MRTRRLDGQSQPPILRDPLGLASPRDLIDSRSYYVVESGNNRVLNFQAGKTPDMMLHGAVFAAGCGGGATVVMTDFGFTHETSTRHLTWMGLRACH